MANVNSLTTSSSSTTSLYGTRNVISGLASGMDTESMIENSVSGYKTKITSIKQEQEKTQWKQDAYRSIIDKMAAMNTTYTSYTSKTNLYSASFFNKSVTSTTGTNADKISATGKATSTIEISEVTQLATAAKRSINASALGLNGVGNATGGALDWTALQGEDLTDKTLNVTFNGATKKIDLSKLDTTSQDKFVDSLQNALNTAFGKDEAGKSKVAVEMQNDSLSFTVGEGSTLRASSTVTGLGLTEGVTNYLDTGKTLGSLLGNDSLTGWFQTNGKLVAANGTVKEGTGDNAGKYFDFSGNEVKKVTVNGEEGYYRVAKDGVSLLRSADLTINGTVVGSFTQDDSLETVMSAINRSDAGVKVSYSTLSNQLTFTATETGTAGNISFGGGLADKLFGGAKTTAEKTMGDALKGIVNDDEWDENGNVTLNIGGKDITFNKDESLLGAVTKYNSVGFKHTLAYDAENDKFTFTNASGSVDPARWLTVKKNGVDTGFDASAIFAGTTDVEVEKGQDAIVKANVNGKDVTLTRASNTMTLDGMTITVKDTFQATSENEKVKFSSSADADAMVSAITSFVNDLNEVMKEVHDAYTTQPLEKSSSSHTRYEPLTEDDKTSMSESAVNAYEEKAKTGLLFGDSDLSSLYNQLRSAISATGDTRKAMEAIGLTTTYKDGVTTLSLDEEKLRSALEADPEKVKAVFTDTTSAGGTTNQGLMSRVKKSLDRYASTSMASPGILVKKAGTKLSSTSLLSNTLQKKIDSYDEQISSWEAKMATKIDYYTRQFTALEKLMNTMNSQSSMLAGMMGY